MARATDAATDSGGRADLAHALIALLSHDLRAPLGPLKLAVSSIAEDAGDPSAVAELIDIANAQIDRLRRLIDSTLIAVRGLPSLNFRQTNLASVVEQAGAIFRSCGGRCRTQGTSAALEADQTALAEAIAGLMECAGGEGGTVDLAYGASGDWAQIVIQGPAASPVGAIARAAPADAAQAFALAASALMSAHGGHVRHAHDAIRTSIPIAKDK